MRARALPCSGDADVSLGAQVGDPAFPTWVLVEDGTIVGSTTVFAESPAWCFTELERSQPAVFLASTFTMPTDNKRLGRLIASWSLNHAFHTGRSWVRRSTFEEQLMRYYRDEQGWTLVREVERRSHTAYVMARHAEPQTDLATAGRFSLSTGDAHTHVT